MDDYDYEYVDDDDATLELDEVAERLKRSVDLPRNHQNQTFIPHHRHHDDDPLFKDLHLKVSGLHGSGLLGGGPPPA